MRWSEQILVGVGHSEHKACRLRKKKKQRVRQHIRPHIQPNIWPRAACTMYTYPTASGLSPTPNTAVPNSAPCQATRPTIRAPTFNATYSKCPTAGGFRAVPDTAVPCLGHLARHHFRQSTGRMRPEQPPLPPPSHARQQYLDTRPIGLSRPAHAAAPPVPPCLFIVREHILK